jgi:hypothetical protein
MTGIETPFWETAYSKEGSANTFNNGKPSWDVVMDAMQCMPQVWVMM